MFHRLKTLSLAGVLVFLLSAVAAAYDPPRVELDWEPDPKDRSFIKVVCDPCGNPKIVGLIGGKKIRPRARITSSIRQ